MRDIIVNDNKQGLWPHPLLTRNDGLLCFAEMTDPQLLLSAYRIGLFPWYEEFGFGAFYFPYQRYVIKPTEVKIPKSLKPYFNQRKLNITFDTCFEKVITQCMTGSINRKDSSWISESFLSVYPKLWKMGYAHSVEVWQENKLVGGLYGVAIGKVFTGESMFSLVPNASKFAFICLAHFLKKYDFNYIDCQVYNSYLASFGGSQILDQEFYKIMQSNTLNDDLVGNWNQLI